MIPVRRIFRLEKYLTDYHFENMSRFILFTSTDLRVRVRERSTSSPGTAGVEPEQTSFYLRAFGPYWFSTWCMIVFNVVFPQLLWFKTPQNEPAVPLHPLLLHQPGHVVRAVRHHHHLALP